MQTTPKRVQPIHFMTLAMRLVIILILVSSTFVVAQDSPGHFELGGEFTAPHNLPNGPGVSGDVNFGRHIALDASYSFLPSGSFHPMTGFFGAKAGVRKEHFGIFGKVRPGFLTIGNSFRGGTIVINQTDISQTSRFARQTQRALDLGGVVEYYPAKHWALRWDLSDMLLFQEPLPVTTVTIVGNGATGATGFPAESQPVSNTFLFSSGIHYRF